MNAQEKLIASSGPSCVKCFGAMNVTKRKTLDGGFGLRYEHRTFQCRTCGHEQTYTAGTSDTPMGGHRQAR